LFRVRTAAGIGRRRTESDKEDPIMSTPRSARLLKLLKDSVVGMRLPELIALIGEEGRDADNATTTMLITLRGKGRVDYTPPPKKAAERGGLYVITEAGEDYLARKLDAHPDWAEELGEGAIETGAMRGEYRTIVQRSANSDDCELPPAPQANWVFGLAQQQQEVQQGLDH
jgi:hypothetical protein